MHVGGDATHFEDQHVAKTLHQHNIYIGTVKFAGMLYRESAPGITMGSNFSHMFNYVLNCAGFFIRC
jgi:hypothetical protein